MAKVDKIEIVGMTELTNALKNLPKEVEASAIRAVARKPANKIISLARNLFPSNTGATARSIGVLKVMDARQRFIEIGIKGRSLAPIFMFWKGKERVKKSGAATGKIQSPGNVVQRAAAKIGNTAIREMQIDLSKSIARALKKYL